MKYLDLITLFEEDIFKPANMVEREKERIIRDQQLDDAAKKEIEDTYGVITPGTKIIFTQSNLKAGSDPHVWHYEILSIAPLPFSTIDAEVIKARVVFEPYSKGAQEWTTSYYWRQFLQSIKGSINSYGYTVEIIPPNQEHS